MTRKASRWEGCALSTLRERWDRPHVHIFSRTDSTNARAVELADDGAPAGTLVLADEQTAGRGLVGRRWHSPKGAGLYLSLVFRPKQLENPLVIPVLAGLGAIRAVEATLGSAPVGFKWPNDLIVRDRKAGGVLSEAAWAGEAPNYFVLGVGVNVNQRSSDFPPELREAAISLTMAAGEPVSRLELADGVIREVEELCAAPLPALDRELLRQFDEYDWLRDRRCAVERGAGQLIRGIAVGIAPDGALLFRPDRGALERVSSGRVRCDDLPLPDY